MLFQALLPVPYFAPSSLQARSFWIIVRSSLALYCFFQCALALPLGTSPSVGRPFIIPNHQPIVNTFFPFFSFFIPTSSFFPLKCCYFKVFLLYCLLETIFISFHFRLFFVSFPINLTALLTQRRYQHIIYIIKYFRRGAFGLRKHPLNLIQVILA